MAKFRILLAGGGSGGHVYPLIAVAHALKEKSAAENVELELLIMGSGKFTQKAAEINKIPFKRVMAGKVRRYFSLENLIDILKMPVGLIQSLWYLFWFMPDAIFAKGGYDSFMPTLAAKIYLIPVFIHESDSVPGLANKILGKMAEKVFTSYEDSAKYFESGRAVLTGNPVRKNLFNARRDVAVKFFNLDPQRKTILILGGSLGAKVINDIILESLVTISERYQLIHQCGESQYEEVKKAADKIIEEGGASYGTRIKEYYHLFPFLEDEAMAMVYAAADVIVSRAGGQLFEIAYLGKPAIIIPRKNSPGNHQFYNALEFSKSGGVMIEEQNLTKDGLVNDIGFILQPQNYSEISQKIKSFAKPDAADKIADELLGILKSVA